MNKLFGFLCSALLIAGGILLALPVKAHADAATCTTEQCQGYQYELSGGYWVQVNATSGCSWNASTLTCFCGLPAGDPYNGGWQLTSDYCYLGSGF